MGQDEVLYAVLGIYAVSFVAVGLFYPGLISAIPPRPALAESREMKKKE